MLDTHYPHIHCLSTVGIIHHGNYDYEFNPWCTSFAGESGLGKSIIADLLQLIFVGPQKGIYESATQSTDDRALEGLVLGEEQGRAKGIGYAFVTIAKAAGSYLTIGCYLEPGSHTAHPFVVQQSHDFKGDLTCFEQPLGYRAFLDAEDMILPPSECKKQLEIQQQLVIKFYTNNFTAYYDCLYRNMILPLDAGSSPSTLRSYAKIIRSFARSGDLVKKDTDLKDFLFGTDKEKAIRKDYDQRVTKMARDQTDYQRNEGRLNDTTARVTNLRELRKLESTAAAAQREYLGAEIAYSHQQTEQARQAWQHAADTAQHLQFDKHKGHAEQARRAVATAEATVRAHGQQVAEQTKLTEKLASLQAEKEAAETTYAEQQQQLTTSQQQMAGIEEAKQWVQRYGGDPAVLASLQRQHSTWRQQRRALADFEARLQSAQALELFEKLNWGVPAEPGQPLKNPMERVAALQAAVDEARRWRAFADLDDPESLARWAYHYGKPLTEEQESVLAHFSHFTQFKGREEKDSRYLASPEQLLFDSPLDYEPGSMRTDGFWLNLDGVREWIRRLPAQERIFAKFDQDRIRQQFQKRNQQVESLEAELQQAQQLLGALEPATDWLLFLPLYMQRDDIRRIPEAELLPADAPALTERLGWLAQADELTERHDYYVGQVKNALNLAEQRGQEKRTLDGRLEELVTLLRDDLPTRENRAQKVRQDQQSVAQQCVQWLQMAEIASDLYAQHKPLLKGNLLPEVPDQELVQWLAIAESGIPASIAAAAQALTTWTQQLDSYRAAKKEYEEKLQESYAESEEADSVVLTKPTPDHWYQHRDEYQQQFVASVVSYVGEGMVKRYQPDKDLAMLIQDALSDTMEALVQADSDTLLDQAERHLRTINERSAQIAERKMQLLGEVFEQVELAVDEYQNEVSKISRYFKRGQTQITGGLRPVLKKKDSPRFPLEWLNFIRKVLRHKEAGDMRSFQRLGEVQGLDELMRAAFREYTQQDEAPTVTELLNPKSYLELEFYMAFPNGEPNRGSTGQTFMFAALLNIARLSIIGRDRPGIRFMAIDEAHGLGSNLTTLLRLARTGTEKYQLISLSVEPLLNEAATQHKQYFLFENPVPNSRLNARPVMVDKTDLMTDSASEFSTSLFGDEPDEPTPAE
jgi:hypothetical protein